MKLDLATHRTLASIHVALLRGDETALAQAFDGVDLSRVLSQETLSTVRALGKTPLVLFLNTLAIHNNVEPIRAAHWLTCYQSVVKKALDPALTALSPRHVLRAVTQSLMDGSDTVGVGRVKGPAQAWQDAVELALDHRNWGVAESVLRQLGHDPSEAETWQQLTLSLSSRHRLYVDETGLQQGAVDYTALAKLYNLCAEAARRYRKTSVFQATKQLRASALEVGGHCDMAIAQLQEIDPSAKNEAIQLDIARCLCKQGDLPAAISKVDQVLLAIAQDRSEKPRDLRSVLGGMAAPTEAQPLFDTQKAAEALQALTDIAEGCNVPVFLVSGTLLGYVREGRLLAHDKDIDVGVIGWEHQYELCLALQRSGRFTVSTQFLNGKDTVYLPVLHNDTGMWIDVFVYHPHGGQLVTGVDFFFGHRQMFGFTPFALKDITFLGVRMKAPADSELNLHENFGPNWRIPDASYISHLESPATLDTGNLAFMLTARLTTLTACVHRQPRKLEKVLALMSEQTEKQCPMSTQLLHALHTHLTDMEPRIAERTAQRRKECDHA